MSTKFEPLPQSQPLSTTGAFAIPERGAEGSSISSTSARPKLQVVAASRPGLWIGTALVGAMLGWFAYTLITNPRFQWDVFGRYLFEPIILKGLGVTLWLTAVAMIVGMLLGLVLAIMRLSDGMILREASAAYIWFFRGTPALVQLIFWYNLAIIFPVIIIKIPFGPELYRASTNDLVTPYVAAILGLSLNEGAYLAEIVRAGLRSVDQGQTEAARALGMKPRQILRRIVLPQAMRFIVPPTGNQAIGMLKLTSLVSVIAMSDLLYSAQTIYGRTFETIPLLLVASFWYLAATTGMTLLQRQLERHYDKGYAVFQTKGKDYETDRRGL